MTDQLTQANFFTTIQLDNETIAVEAYREGDHYRANISGGWWTATGNTVKAAISAVTNSYEREAEWT